ncbi:MAG TPA: YfdX family protein [Candidatus Angelobacter sp.]|jgi:hypothetical protein|nr:YfdX family protein [Candidatus Angelobacter sp.]
MKETIHTLLMATSLSFWSGLAILTGSGAVGESAASQSQGQADTASQHKDAEKQARPEIEKQRQQQDQQGQQSVDKDAVAALQETQKAITAIAANKTSDALAAIEQATGKINILLARNPSKGLIPVSVEVDVIDNAPRDARTALELAMNAAKAMDDDDFPAARVLLDALRSEIRDRTYHLPLATYPDALKEAARLLDQKKNDEAKDVLLTAMNTLVAIDKVTPIPLLLARTALNGAQVESQKDKAAAQKLLEAAKAEVMRAKQLGYAGKDPEYVALNNDISNLEKQLKGGGEIASLFNRLKAKLAAFTNRQSSQQHKQQQSGSGSRAAR